MHHFREMQEGPITRHSGVFLVYLAFWLLSSANFFVLLRTFAFCVHLSWQQWEWKWLNGKCRLARFGKKGSVNFDMQSFQLSLRLKLYHLCPSLGVQELLFPLILAGSDRTCTKGFEPQVSPQHPEDVDVCGRGGWVNWESMALLCSSSRTHDIIPAMSIASSNIRDISWCAGADSISGRSPGRGGTSSTGLYCC